MEILVKALVQDAVLGAIYHKLQVSAFPFLFLKIVIEHTQHKPGIGRFACFRYVHK